MKIHTETILVIDSDINICKILTQRLTRNGFTVLTMTTSEDISSIIHTEVPDLIILDIMLTNINGYIIFKKLKDSFKIPIILLTALNNINDRVLGFELGAIDYIVKPFALKELELRIQSVFLNIKKKQILQFAPNFYQFNAFQIDLTNGALYKNGKYIKLTGIEFKLLELFINKAGENLSRSFILNNIWEYIPERQADLRIIDVHVSRLRAKLEQTPNDPNLILTIRGIGYKFQNLPT